MWTISHALLFPCFLRACAITSETLVGTLGPVLHAIFFPSIFGAKVKEMCSNNPSLRGVLYNYIVTS